MSAKPEISTRLTSNTLTCRFTVKPALQAEAAVYFSDAKQAKGSWLAEEIFKLPGVTAVKIAPAGISVTRDTHDDWPSVTRPVAGLICQALKEGKPVVARGTPSNMPSPETIREKVSDILEKQINPAVAGHGGFIELIEVKESIVYVRLGGGCQGCGMANVTLKQGVERAFRDAVPEIDEVLDVTDHAGGTNPYYAPSKK